ncbi:hypothetical protein GBF38_014814, partial [Nibea albiflora]
SFYLCTEEEITYITYQSPVSPVRLLIHLCLCQTLCSVTVNNLQAILLSFSQVKHEAYGDTLKRRGKAEPDEDEESDRDTEPPIQITKRTANHSAVRSKKTVRKSGGGVWKAIRLLLLLAVLAAALYYAYCYVINNEENPFGVQ